MEDQYLKAFIGELNNERQIYTTSFSQLYEYGITQYTEYLKSEIKKNLLVLDKKIYIDYVEEKLKILPCMSISDDLIDKWITKFKITNSNFPYFDSSELKTKLKTYINRTDVDYNVNDESFDKDELISLQIDFYLYGSKLEVNKILMDINTYKEGSTMVNATIVNDELIVEDINDNPIFKSIESFKLFNSLTEYLGISKNDINKRGVQAKFNGIWSCQLSRDEIFKNSTSLEDYVKYLNSEFKTSFKSRSMSDGSNYHKSIKEYF